MHKCLRVQLPDLRYLDVKADFSVKTFNAVMQLCRDLGLRHPEELSFSKPLEPSHLKYNYGDIRSKSKTQNGKYLLFFQIFYLFIFRYKGYKNGHTTHPTPPPDTNTFIAAAGQNNQRPHSPAGSTGSLERSHASPFMCAPMTPSRSPAMHPPSASTPISSPVTPVRFIDINLIQNFHLKLHFQAGTWKRTNGYGSDELNGSYSPNVNTSISLEQLNGGHDSTLAHTPPAPSPEAKRHMIRPKSLVEKARMNVA